MGGGMVGGIANEMYNNDVGKGVVYAYEAYEAKKRVATFRAPFYFINLGLIPDRHRYCTYLYYSRARTHTQRQVCVLFQSKMVISTTFVH
jgi:hypothetical protein